MSAARNLRLEVVLKAIDKFTAPFKGVLNQSKAVAKQVSALKNKMKELDKTQGQIDSFKKLTRDAAQTSLQMKAAQERATALGKSLAETATPTKKLSAEFERAKKEAAQLAEKHTQLVGQQQNLRTSLNAAGVSTRNLSQHQRELQQNASSTTAALQKEQQQLERLGKQSQRLHAAKASYEKGMNTRHQMAGAGAGMAVAGGGALYAAKQVMAPGLDFDAGMSSVQALTRLDKNSPQLIALRKQARELGAATSFTANEAAQGQGFLAMSGFDPKAIQQAMPGVLDLARAGRVELPAAADMASNILTGFKLNAEQMGRAGDVLVGTFTRSNVDLRMLADTMRYAAPVAADLGVDLETAAAMTGKLGDAGIQASMGGTALRAIMSRLAAPPKAAAEALKALGIQAKDAKGNLRDLPTILAELEAKTKKMGNAQRAGYFKHIAGEEAFSALQVLTAQAGSGKLQELIATLKKSAGEASANAKIMSDNAAGDIKSLQSAWEDVGIEMFEGSNSPLRELLQNITSVIRQVGAWMKANPTLAATLVKVSVSAAAVVAILGGLALSAAALLGPFVMLKLAMTTLNVQMGIGSTLTKAATLSYGKLGGAFSLLSKKNPKAILQSIGSAVSTLNANIKTTLLDLLKNKVPEAMRSLSAASKKTWSTAATAVKGYTASIWQAIRAQGVMAASKATGAMQYARTAGIAGMAKDAAKGGANLAVKGGKGLLNGGIGLIKLPIKAVMQLGQALAFVGRLALTNPIGLALTGIALAALLIYKYWEPIKAFFTGLWQGFTEGIAPLKAIFVHTFTPLMAALQPLMPVWDWMVGAFKIAWEWVSKLFAPIQSTKESLEGATRSGSGFGQFLAHLVVIVAEVLAAFIGLPIKIMAIGVQIVEGLWQGIASKWDWLKGKFYELAKMLPEPVQKALDIHSPSRVFAQIGRHTVAGLDQGLTDGKDAPLATMKNITNQIINAASGLMIGGASLGAMADVTIDKRPPIANTAPANHAASAPVFQITIHAAPGMDEQKLAQLVAKEIAKAERQKQVRSRSRLGDND
jgi:TP901 family phage tail tape measure protein